ncbi:hypothetical protein COP2_038607 [Malus domestica]
MIWDTFDVDKVVVYRHAFCYACLHMLYCILLTCPICSSGRCGIFSGSIDVEDEYSREMLGKNKTKGKDREKA